MIMKKHIMIMLLISLATAIYAQNLSLDTCKQLALENNKKIKSAELKYSESSQLKKDAFTKFFPNVSAGAVAIKANDYLLKEKIPEANLPVYDGNPVNLLTPTEFAYFPGMDLNLFDYANMGYVTAVQPVFAGGRIVNANKLAKQGEEIMENKLILTKEEVVFNIEENYWTLISLKEKKKTINSYDTLLKNLHDDIEVAYVNGLIEKSDLLKVELKINELKGKKLKLDNAIEMLSRMMCNSMGLEYNDSINILCDDLRKENNYSSQSEDSLAYTKRQEYIMLKRLLEIEKLQKRMEVGESLPQISVGLMGYYADMMDKENTNYLGFATLKIPISDWWGGFHRIKEHNIKIEIARNELSDKSDMLQLQIRNTDNELKESEKQISIAECSVLQAKENLKITEDNYKAGLLNTSDLLEAQAILQEAQDNLSDAICIYKIKQAAYKKNRGIINY